MTTPANALLVAHQVQADLARLQQYVRGVRQSTGSHLALRRVIQPGAPLNEPRDWLRVVTGIQASVGQLREEMARLEARLPGSSPLGIKVSVQGTRKAIERELVQLWAQVEASRVEILRQINDPGRTDELPQGGTEILIHLFEVLGLCLKALRGRSAGPSAQVK